ncbi:MAG: YdeI/OmpD-associated family protein [Pseudomonadota bacterium]
MTEDWQTFDAMIEPMEWGKNTYTILRIPGDVMAALPQGTRRVEGEFGDFPINLALTKAPVIEGTFVYTGKTFLKDSGLEPGEVFEARIRSVDADQVDMPEDVSAALRAAGRSADWDALTAGNQRGRLHAVNTAKRTDTRARRITKLISEL